MPLTLGFTIPILTKSRSSLKSFPLAVAGIEYVFCNGVGFEEGR